MGELGQKTIYDERNLRKAMKDYCVKVPLHFYKKTTSTMILAEKSKQTPLLIAAKMQTQGKGRKDRKFISNPGGIYFSYIFAPDVPPSDGIFTILLCGIAVIRALKKFGVDNAKLKWPNDIYIGKKKICGILSQLSTSFDNIEKITLGVGINVDNEVQKHVFKAENLQTICGRYFDKNAMLCQIVKCIDDVFAEYSKDGYPQLRQEYLDNCNFLNKTVEVIQNGTFAGKAIDVNERGFLLVKTEEGKIIKVISGDVTVLE